MTVKSIAPSLYPLQVAPVTEYKKVKQLVVVKFGPFTQVVSHLTLQLYVVVGFKPGRFSTCVPKPLFDTTTLSQSVRVLSLYAST